MLRGSRNRCSLATCVEKGKTSGGIEGFFGLIEASIYGQNIIQVYFTVKRACSSKSYLSHSAELKTNSKQEKIIPKPVGHTAKISLPSNKQFTAIFWSRFSAKLK